MVLIGVRNFYPYENVLVPVMPDILCKDVHGVMSMAAGISASYYHIKHGLKHYFTLTYRTQSVFQHTTVMPGRTSLSCRAQPRLLCTDPGQRFTMERMTSTGEIGQNKSRKSESEDIGAVVYHTLTMCYEYHRMVRET